MTAVSSVVYVLDSLIPFPVPFGRWGFSNFVVLWLASETGLRDAVTVAALKSMLGSVLTGSFLSVSFFVGFPGSVSAALVESLLATFGFGYVGLSVAGSFVNNFVQLMVVSHLVGTRVVFSIFPMIVALGSVSAVANAFLASRLGGVILENHLSFFFAEKERADEDPGSAI